MYVSRSDICLRKSLITPEQIAASKRKNKAAAIAAIVTDLDREFGQFVV